MSESKPSPYGNIPEPLPISVDPSTDERAREFLRAVTLNRIDRTALNDRLSKILPDSGWQSAPNTLLALAPPKRCSRSNNTGRPKAWPRIIECGTHRGFGPGSSPSTIPGASTAFRCAAARVIRSLMCGYVTSYTECCYRCTYGHGAGEAGLFAISMVTI